MFGTATKPFWIDESAEKQEGYFYGEENTRVLALEYEGRSIWLLMPECLAPTEVKVTAVTGDLLFLLGVQRDEEDVNGDIIDGGYGVVMVARRHPEREGVYSLFVWHALFEETLPRAGVMGND